MVTTAYQWMNMYKALREIKQLILHINKKKHWNEKAISLWGRHAQQQITR